MRRPAEEVDSGESERSGGRTDSNNGEKPIDSASSREPGHSDRQNANDGEETKLPVGHQGKPGIPVLGLVAFISCVR